MDDINLSNIDEHIEFWRKECEDIDPHNVDSMDRGCDIRDETARKAICAMSDLLRLLKQYMEGQKNSAEKLPTPNSEL